MALRRTEGRWEKAQSSSVMLQVAPGFTFVPVKKTYSTALAVLFISVCDNTLSWVHMYIDRHADVHGRLLSPLKRCTNTEKTRVLANFDKDLMIKQPCWLNTSTITWQTQNISVTVARRRQNSARDLRCIFTPPPFFFNWNLNSKITSWDVNGVKRNRIWMSSSCPFPPLFFPHQCPCSRGS